MAYVIKDLNSSEYYRNKPGKTGWYSVEIEHARVYGSSQQAKKTIDSNNHHVSYPGNRTLKVCEVKIVEV